MFRDTLQSVRLDDAELVYLVVGDGPELTRSGDYDKRGAHRWALDRPATSKRWPCWTSYRPGWP